MPIELPISFFTEVTFLFSKPHGIIPSKYDKSFVIFKANPCIVTHLLTLTPIAHIFLSLYLPTSRLSFKKLIEKIIKLSLEK